MNKVILITGGSRGIGKSIVENFANNNDQVIFWYKNSTLLAQALSDKYPNVCAMQVDITVEVQVINAIKTIISTYKTIDVLVNNAGISTYNMLVDSTINEWQTMLDHNVTGMYITSREVAKHMLYSSGKIINISSMWGLVGSSCEVIYSTTKASIIGFTKALAKELAPNINVNCVAPGAINTDMMQSFTEDELAEIIDNTPLKRLGTPEDIANAVFFLASAQSDFITGEVLSVNGGYVI